LNTNETSTLDTADRMIASGVISGEINYDDNNVTLTLFDNTSKYHKTVPINTVDSATYTNAPANNIGKPIPMAYGDFYEKTDIGTIPTTLFDRFKTFYKGAFPAIITDRYDVGVAGSEAKVDSQAIHTLDDENVYYYKSGNYATLTGTVDATSNNPVIEFEGSRCKAYFPLSSSGFTASGTGTHTYETNISNGDFGDSNKTTITVTSGNNVTVNFGVEPVSKLGEYVGVTGLAKFGTISGTFGGLNLLALGGQAFSNPATNEEKETALSFGSAEQSSWDFTGGIALLLSSSSGDKSVEISEVGMVVEFDIDDIDSHEVEELYEILQPSTQSLGLGLPQMWDAGFEKVTRTRTESRLVPSKTDYVYCSGKGRKYGAWIDTIDSGARNSKNGDAADPGYAANDLIENPVYIIESILRSELSLDSSTTGADIDITSFDYSGNTTNGYLGDIYEEDAVSDIKFAFSQYKFINSKDMIERLGRLCFSYVFIGGDGKFKIKTLRRTDDYSSADQTVDFNDIDLGKVGKTSLGTVKNSILVKYNHDYGAKQNKSEATATDATSAGNTVSGYSLNPSSGDASYMKLEIDANEIIDSTTASALASAYLEIMKDRHDTVDFTCVRPKYNHLEIGDIINFSNWPAGLKIYGQTMGGSWDSTTSTFSS
ncbi:MAG: hypothetical protein QF769_06770, partial [Candidatus Marinimicrobia bacterium]|nr:hypothetical protein [Candidatus Neomarinimicrobiota bacterium]